MNTGYGGGMDCNIVAVTEAHRIDTPYKSWCQHNYFKAASLKGIKRISLFSGHEDDSRLPEFISGLMLEYYHGDGLVVGQWMRGVASFDLTAADQIVRITLWYTRNDRRSSASHKEESEYESWGKVLRMDLETSSGQKYSHAQGAIDDESIELYYCTTPYEELVICNEKWAYMQLQLTMI
jgi:hypothetical protein